MNEQIKEMANDIAKICPDLVENGCGQVNCVTHLTLSLYNIGYRKQIKGEWIKPTPYSEEVCSNCGRSPKIFFGLLSPYCPTCGAIMEGGE